MSYTDQVGTVARLTAAVSYPNGQVQETNFNLVCAAATAGDSRMAVLNWFNSIWTGHYLSWLAGTTTYFGSKLSVVNTPDPWLPVVTHISAAGSSPDPFLPTQVRGLIHWYTDFRRPRGVGTSYMPTPCATALTTGGSPTPAYVTAIDGMASALQVGTSVGGTIWVPVVVHRPKPPGSPIAPFPITSHLASQRWATQRRGGERGRLNTAPW